MIFQLKKGQKFLGKYAHAKLARKQNILVYHSCNGRSDRVSSGSCSARLESDEDQKFGGRIFCSILELDRMGSYQPSSNRFEILQTSVLSQSSIGLSYVP
jgi:hypothetical protein